MDTDKKDLKLRSVSIGYGGETLQEGEQLVAFHLVGTNHYALIAPKEALEYLAATGGIQPLKELTT